MEEDSEHGFLGLIRSLLKRRTHIENGSELQDEIHELMDEGQARGFISGEESHMVFRILGLKDMSAQSIMIPRTEISSAPLSASLGEILQLVTRCGHTRIPIYERDLDSIVGILHAKDLLKLWGKGLESRLPRELLREPRFVPGSQRLSELFRDLKSTRTHMAVITDEYGGTDGIVTLEDILEEIVGEIFDEYDAVQPLLTVLDDTSVQVDARLEIEKLEEYLGKSFPRQDYESVGGLLIHLAGKIPQAGETLQFKDLTFTVQERDARRIKKILVQWKGMDREPDGASPP